MGTNTASDLLSNVSGTSKCPLDYLREDEGLQFYLTGRGHAFVPDQRILKAAGYPATEFRIEYADVEAVDVEDATTDSTIQVETSDRSYSLSADENTEDERRECAEYIREQVGL
ncbi:hypothetical protein BRD00_14370 [Halobacteriales archaeon QS_8_69_26]|nr:MAG: hypothetical protein BRD00_14370 [Halobacteriales archaeon QS_8_69_26]